MPLAGAECAGKRRTVRGLPGGSAQYRRQRMLLARHLASEPGARILDGAGEDAAVAERLLARDPTCRVLVTCGDVRSYREARQQATALGDRVAVMLSDGLDDVEETGWDAIALTLPAHLSPTSGERLIFEAAVRAAGGGALWLATSSKAGKRARASATEAFGPGERIASVGGRRVDRHVMSGGEQGRAEPRRRAQELARQEQGEAWLELPAARLRFETRIGVFAYRAVDAGTRLLLDWALKLPPARRVLDAGCGYGAIGVAAAVTWPEAEVALIDVDLRSARLAQRNVRLNGLTSCTVELADAATDLPVDAYDLVLSNLPAHEGRERSLELLRGISRALRPSGTLAAVVPRDSGVCQFAEAVFGEVTVVEGMGGHEVLTAGYSAGTRQP
jgi:16S rRNA (guanine1207-N2)-methyltransferase